jgi:RimJ/RimL family protein N-acetyltransferase
MVGTVVLRNVRERDLPAFFEHQLDADANHMAAFTAEDPEDRTAFVKRWARILSDRSIIKRTILYDDQVVGHIVSFERLGVPEVSYWIDKKYWGQGIATRALEAFLACVQMRPLFARVAKDNIGSLRVLQKCGFVVSGEDSGFANARGAEVEEFVLKLEEPPDRS